VTFRPGDDRINRDGRPPDPAVAISNIIAEAQRLERMLALADGGPNRAVVASMLMGEDADLTAARHAVAVADAERARASAQADLRHLLTAVTRLQAVAGDLPRPRRRKRPVTIHENAYARSVAECAIALDRLVSVEGGPQ
jgi:hypothetical protein